MGMFDVVSQSISRLAGYMYSYLCKNNLLDQMSNYDLYFLCVQIQIHIVIPHTPPIPTHLYINHQLTTLAPSPPLKTDYPSKSHQLHNHPPHHNHKTRVSRSERETWLVRGWIRRRGRRIGGAGMRLLWWCLGSRLGRGRGGGGLCCGWGCLGWE